MVEPWMKQKAARSKGGPCMTRFEENREKKRIARLKNIKSSVATSMKHDGWTQETVERRRRQLQEQRRLREAKEEEVGEKQMDLVIKLDGSETTKSGLRIRLDHQKRSSKNNVEDIREKMVNKQKRRSNGENRKELASYSEGNDYAKYNEGKENKFDLGYSALDLLQIDDFEAKKVHSEEQGVSIPGENTKGSRRKSKESTSDIRHNSLKKEKNPSLIKPKQKMIDCGIGCKKNLTKSSLSSKRRDHLQKKTHDQTDGQEKNKNCASKQHIKTMKSMEYNRANRRTKLSNQYHNHKGNDISALTKEKEEALQILNDLEKSLDIKVWDNTSVNEISQTNSKETPNSPENIRRQTRSESRAEDLDNKSNASSESGSEQNCDNNSSNGLPKDMYMAACDSSFSQTSDKDYSLDFEKSPRLSDDHHCRLEEIHNQISVDDENDNVSFPPRSINSSPHVVSSHDSDAYTDDFDKSIMTNSTGSRCTNMKDFAIDDKADGTACTQNTTLSQNECYDGNVIENTPNDSLNVNGNHSDVQDVDLSNFEGENSNYEKANFGAQNENESPSPPLLESQNEYNTESCTTHSNVEMCDSFNERPISSIQDTSHHSFNENQLNENNLVDHGENSTMHISGSNQSSPGDKKCQTDENYIDTIAEPLRYNNDGKLFSAESFFEQS